MISAICLMLGSLAWAGEPAAPPTQSEGDNQLSKLDIFTQGYPRAFYFWTNTRRILMNPDSDWRREFLGLQGVSSPSELWPNFLEYKTEHPEKLVYLFTQGQMFAEKPCQYDPIDRSQLFAGHWVYFEGCRLTRDAPAQEGEMVLQVENPARFRVQRVQEARKVIQEDVALCALDAQGRPDWNRCEQVRLLAVDAKNKTIKVRRAQYGTKPLAFKGGKAWAASHAYETWGSNGGISWLVNYAPDCPKDPEGRTAADRLVEMFSALFAHGGALEKYDGIEFDAFPGSMHSAGRAGRGLDSNGDGRADGGLRQGVNVYGLGVYDFVRRMRERLGDGKLLLADGGPTSGHQRAFDQLNGVESEWWPQWTDMDVSAWSSGMNLHEFLRQNTRQPQFSYFVHKIGAHDVRKWNQTPFHIHRLVLAAAQFQDAAITTFFQPPLEPGEKLGSFDEMRKGVERQPGWLGQPSGPAVRLALASRDLLDGSGRSASPALLRRFTGENVKFETENKAVKLTSTDQGAGTQPASRMLKFTIDNLPCEGPDLLVAFTIKADPRPGHPELMPRHVSVNVSGQKQQLTTFANPRPFDATFYFRNVQGAKVTLEIAIEGGEPVWISNLNSHAHPDAMYRVFDRGIVLANPSDHDYTFDLKALVPGAEWHRIQGSPRQDSATNDGQPVTGPVTLGPRDGLFLARR